jgi:Rab-like protein 2
LSRSYRPSIPALLAANKIDENPEVTEKNFNFATKNNIPLYYVSASDGTNVVRLFRWGF